MNEFNKFRLECKAAALEVGLLSILGLLIFLGAVKFIDDNLALNIVYYCTLILLAVMFGAIAVLIWYAVTSFVVPVHKKRISGVVLNKKYTTDEVDERKEYYVEYVYGLFVKRFVVKLEECNE